MQHNLIARSLDIHEASLWVSCGFLSSFCSSFQIYISCACQCHHTSGMVVVVNLWQRFTRYAVGCVSLKSHSHSAAVVDSGKNPSEYLAIHAVCLFGLEKRVVYRIAHLLRHIIHILATSMPESIADPDIAPQRPSEHDKRVGVIGKKTVS